MNTARKYIKLVEPEILRTAGKEAVRNGMSKLTSRQIDRIIEATRAEMKKRSVER
jgi:hypothetical protein